MRSLWDRALQIARRAHAGQVDKGGRPYIEHPIAVAAMVDTEREKAAALLHDVIEDSGVTAEQLEAEGIDPDVIRAVVALTKTGEPYDRYLERVKADAIARPVKIADLRHNMDLSRMGKEPDQRDLERLDKYRKALQYLTT